MNIIASVLNGPRNLLAGSRSPILLAMTVMAAALLLGACSSNDNDPGFPTPPDEEPNNFLFDVFGTDANNVYACGDRGAMFHFDGTSWTEVDMGTRKAITTIWGLPGDNTLYAVGHGGAIWRNTGGGWNGMTSGTTKDLYGIGQFAGQIHAVGFEGTIRRLNGSSWGGQPGLTRRTPELRGIVQETVNLPEWQVGGPMAFLIWGFGQRVVTAYDGDPALAPQLHIEYSP